MPSAPRIRSRSPDRLGPGYRGRRTSRRPLPLVVLPNQEVGEHANVPWDVLNLVPLHTAEFLPLSVSPGTDWLDEREVLLDKFRYGRIERVEDRLHDRVHEPAHG